MIKLNHVTKEYKEGVPALADVSFHIRKGEFAFLTGHSGSGKSTTLRLIHMAERPTDGEVRVSGFSSLRTPAREVWKVRRRVGHVFQDFRLLPGRTALENVAFALEVTGASRADIVPRAQRLLAKVGLAPRSGSRVDEMSGGERQRIAIARALANDPVVLLADEPTGNLDTKTSLEIMELLEYLNRDEGLTVIMVTHEAEMAAYAGRIIRFLDGRIDHDATNRDAA